MTIPTLILHCLVVAAFRAADLWSTFLASPDMRHELNPIYRAVGWRRSIALNLVAVPIIGLLWWPEFAATVCVISALVSMWNFWCWWKYRRI